MSKESCHPRRYPTFVGRRAPAPSRAQVLVALSQVAVGPCNRVHIPCNQAYYTLSRTLSYSHGRENGRRYRLIHLSGRLYSGPLGGPQVRVLHPPASPRARKSRLLRRLEHPVFLLWTAMVAADSRKYQVVVFASGACMVLELPVAVKQIYYFFCH
jgi:hypothetical protein